MTRKRLIPLLLFNGVGLVKTRRFTDAQYLGDPLNAVRIFNEKEVDELIFLDITATAEGREPNESMIADVASECFMPIGYGGGIRNINQMQRIFRLGVEKICLNSAAIERPELVSEAAAVFGSQSVIVSIDVKRNWFGRHEVVAANGRRSTGLTPVAHARSMQQHGAGELLVTSTDRDGMLTGYDLDLIRSVSAAVTVPVVAAGGAGKLDHLSDAIAAGASAVAAGALLVLHGRHRAVLISYPSSEELDEALVKRPKVIGVSPVSSEEQ